jgi:urease accessory protein UreE
MKRRFDILLPLADNAPQGESCWRDDWNVSGQSAFMLLAKFQQLNALSCSALATMFVRKPGPRVLQRDIDLRDARQFDLLRMMYLLRMSLPEVAAAFLARWDLSEVESDPTLRWCAQCAARGVHLTAFQFSGCDTCPVHGCKLRDRCAQCGRTMVAYRLRASVFRSPFSCPACGHDWAPALRSIDDRALRLSPAYRYSVAQSLARGWFGRRDPSVGRLLRPFDRAGDRVVWLGSAPRRGSDTDAADAFCHRIVRGHTDAGQYVSVRDRDRSCAVRGLGDELRTGTAPEFLASRVKTRDEILTDAIACYKAIKRYVMHHIGNRHRACVVTAARYLTWRLDARTTKVAVQMGGDRRRFPSAGQRRPRIPRRPCLAFAVRASWPAPVEQGDGPLGDSARLRSGRMQLRQSG